MVLTILGGQDVFRLSGPESTIHNGTGINAQVLHFLFYLSLSGFHVGIESSRAHLSLGNSDAQFAMGELDGSLPFSRDYLMRPDACEWEKSRGFRASAFHRHLYIK
jgi:hypothetical protein